MSSNLKVNTILPSTGSNVAIGTAGGTVTMVGNVDIDINSGISTFNDIHVSDKIVHDGDTNTAIRFPAADTITAETGGTERLRINSSGQMGLGTNNPVQQAGRGLHINGTDQARLKLTNTSSGATANDGIDIILENGLDTHILNHENGNLKLGTNDAEKLRIDSSGRLLIGTTNEGNANADDLTIATTGHTGITLRSGTSNYGQIFFSDAESGTGEYEGIIAYDHSNNSMVFHTTRAERLRITSGGNVNIGGEYTQTTYPFQLTGSGGGEAAAMAIKNQGSHPAKLHLMSGHGNWSVSNSSTVGDALEFRDESANSTRMLITSAGKVGINKTPDASGGLVQLRYNEVFTSGTTNLLTSSSKAVFRLQTSSNSSKSLFFGGIDESATPYLQVGNMSSASGGATATYPLVFQPYGGNVAIGNASPQQLLHVWPDNANTTSAYIRVTSGDRNSNTGIDLGSDANGNGRLNVVSNGDLKLYTNNTERLNITSAGHVQTLSNPSFRAGLNSNTTFNQSTDIIFNDTGSTWHYNRGNHYNTSNGRFTAPVSGVYQFNACVIWYGAQNNTFMGDAFHFYVNGGNACYSGRRAFYNTGTTGNSLYYTDHMSVNLYLNSTDYITIRQSASVVTVHGNTYYTWFAGTFLG